jgi:hypothetical protein
MTSTDAAIQKLALTSNAYDRLAYSRLQDEMEASE